MRAKPFVRQSALIEVRDPLGHLLEIVGAGNHVSVVSIEPVSRVRVTAAGQDRRWILGGNSDHFRSIILTNATVPDG